MVITGDDIPLGPVTSVFTHAPEISVSVLRLDKLHPVVSGNKWYKLKYNLEAAVQAGFKQLITFGGAYSNHLVATAAAAQASNLQSLGIVRGFHGQAQPTPTLKACMAYGMKLRFVSREDYALKETPAFIAALGASFGRGYMIPEGGDNEAGRKGTMEIAALIPPGTTHVCLPVGTGTTLAGLRNALPPSVQVIGFPAMKDSSLQQHITDHLLPAQNTNWLLEDRFYFGGFAKTTPELLQFMRLFYRHEHIPLDIVYTGKMMYGVYQLSHEYAFPAGARIVCLHTGGLQGNPEDLYEEQAEIG